MLIQISTAARSRQRQLVAETRSRILVVRHGVHRGPRIHLRALRPAQCQPMFDDICHRYPSFAQRLSYWETGQPAANLDDVAAIIFQLQDPLRELYPACYRDAVELTQRATGCGIRVINGPNSLSNTIKTTQSQIWRAAGLPTPDCLLFHTADELYDQAAQIDGPMIVKANHLHAQKRTIVVDNFQALKRVAIGEIPFPGSLSPLIDTRSGYAGINPASPYASHFHKKRAMVFGNHVQNNHVFFADQPVVGCMSSTFRHFQSFNPIHRAMQNSRFKAHLQTDIEYHYSEPEQPELLVSAARSLGVEFCAIDYSTYADGRIVLWEANPYFSLHRWPIAVLSKQRRLQERTPRIHDAAAAFFADLVGIPA
jgi:hypothetical protein